MTSPTFNALPRHRLVCAVLGCALLAACASQTTTAPAARAPLGLGAPATPAVAESASVQPSFAAWVADFSIAARAAGIQEPTLRAALGEVRLLPRVIELDRAQPEFTRTVWDYLDRSLTTQRVATGQAKLTQVRPQADAATARYGVPAPVLVAIWGMESNYGTHTGETSTIDALATLGFEGRRADWARAQLIAALKILQSGDIDRVRMVGSWAGAMGQTQFLPSSYLAYAVDADGDGRRDLWGSMADVMASTANFLAKAGWRADQPGCVEVKLPIGFDAGRADPSIKQSASQWASEGVQTADAATLPAWEGITVLQPAGARGPAFLVGTNFGAILRYNNSTSYALAVCLLAQRLAGAPGVQAPWPRELQALNRGQLMAMQTALKERGFDSGTPDGVMGPATRAALRAFQRSAGLVADGYPTMDLLVQLQQTP